MEINVDGGRDFFNHFCVGIMNEENNGSSCFNS